MWQIILRFNDETCYRTLKCGDTKHGFQSRLILGIISAQEAMFRNDPIISIHERRYSSEIRDNRSFHAATLLTSAIV